MPCLVCSQPKDGERSRVSRDFASTSERNNEPIQ
jgi:hypothetical protein